MTSRRMKNIDSNKLRGELKKRGLKGREISCELGHSSSYIGVVLATAKINTAAMKCLETLYNIKPEAYVLEDEPAMEVPADATAEPEQPAFDWVKFYNVMYEATYNAFKKVMSE